MTIRLRLTTGTILEGDLDRVAPHFIRVHRSAVEDERGKRTEFDSMQLTVHKLHIVSVMVSGVTDGKNLMINNEELLEATELAIQINSPVEIRTTALSPADFAQELCELENAA